MKKKTQTIRIDGCTDDGYDFVQFQFVKKPCYSIIAQVNHLNQWFVYCVQGARVTSLTGVLNKCDAIEFADKYSSIPIQKRSSY